MVAPTTPRCPEPTPRNTAPAAGRWRTMRPAGGDTFAALRVALDAGHGAGPIQPVRYAPPRGEPTTAESWRTGMRWAVAGSVLATAVIGVLAAAGL